jgi:triosephosphate isomerase (TIM)
MGRRKIFAGNWKMYKTHDDAVALVKSLIEGIGGITGKEIAVFPPSPYIRDISLVCKGKIDTGVQNIHFEPEGAFTGEVAAKMAKDCGCRYALIGHSERRHVFKESDDDVNKKITAALTHGLDPMVCIGELLEERENGKTNSVIKKQIDAAFKNITKEQMKSVVIAYEPVWAIGTGKVATPEMAEEVHKFTRELIGNLYGKEIAETVPVLYGGSVKPDNISGLMLKENIDGVLVGGASLKADSFLDIIKVK